MARLMLLVTACVMTLAWWVRPLQAAPPTHRELSKKIVEIGNQLTPFPPSFLGHPIAYAGAVFGQLTIFSFALAVIFFLVSITDLKRDGIYVPTSKKRSWKSPVNVYRVSIMLYMSAVVCGVLGNLLIYLSWNEVAPSTLNVYFTIDKVLKAFAIVPFMAASYLLLRYDDVITYHLAVRNPAVPLWPNHESVKEHSKTIFLVLVMAVGVTYAKWGASVGT